MLTVVITFAIVFFGEIVPKVYAARNGYAFAAVTAGMLKVADKMVYPLAWVLMNISNVIEKRIDRKGYTISVNELHHALEMTSDEDTTEEEKDILKGIVNFSTLNVRQVMRSRVDIMAVDFETDFHELMDKVNKSGYSRIPVYRETIDKIEGILYIKDLLPFIEENEGFVWQDLIRPGFFVPENKKVDGLLKDFQEKRVHMAIVVDEYGGTSGLITLEDLIEEIIGEINDEFDDEDDVNYTKLDESTFIFEGKVSLNDFCRKIDVSSNIFDEVKGESESLGGLLLELNTKLPKSGTKIKYEEFEFTILAVDTRKIKKVKVTIKSESEKNLGHYED